ncbi:putative amino acid permease YhdG [Limihaloglobus sulfuriphilus]|uniref:Putative amino acid permease YhdG n=1 Tax=Limihaloglobus sulfuriphilus TaxID=1851148 RepID=A0A1Q2MIM6_9BACT|nr:amino acid permease [Limihaloglobus sulfuriphilus]AQQ72514.1 putative amino acid permease YhdG [Limihaloglobus sulfuriphilus]
MPEKNKQHTNMPTPELSRELTLFHITMMGLGMMIGAGVFLGMGISIGRSGPGGVILTFALNGLLAMLTAMSFAELSSAIPRAGGAYNFARIAFGRGTSFLAGWMEWFASTVAGAMYALTFAIYTMHFLDAIGWINTTALLEKTVAVAIASLFIFINYKGSSETGKIGAIITMGQTLFVITIGFFGIAAVVQDPSRLENFVPFMPEGWDKILITMGFTYVAFEGYEVIAQAGDEAIEPRKNLPKAMIYSVIIVTFIYVLVAFATVVSVKAGSEGIDVEPWAWIGQYEEKGFGEAVGRLMPYGNFILTLAVIFSSTSALNATIYSGTRASFALGRDGMLPRFFSKIHPKNNTPHGALVASSCIILFVAAFLPTADVASSASIMFLFLFFLVNLCVIKIRRSMADELEYGFMLPLFPLPPLLAIVCQAVLAVWLVHMSAIAWIVAPIWIVSGVMIFWGYSRTRAHVGEHEIQIIDEEKSASSDEKKYSLMVAVSNPANATELVQAAYHISGAKDARVELINMVAIPSQMPLEMAGQYVKTGREAIYEVMLYLSLHFPVNTTIRYCRNVARGIVSAIREKKTKMLVMGWHGKHKLGIFSVGSTIDPIIEQAPCNVVVLKNCGGNKSFKRIFIPAAGGPNAGFAMEVASMLASGEPDTKITVGTIKNPGRNGFNLEDFVKTQCKKRKLEKSLFDFKTISSQSTIESLIKESSEYDLVIVGISNKPMLSQVFKSSIPEELAKRCDMPVMLVKAGGGMQSFIRRWI